MRRGSILQIAAIAVVVGILVSLMAVFVPWLPAPAAREAGRIDFVFWFVTAICIAIFSIVIAAIIYSVLRFRAAPGDDSDGPPIHGHTGLEIVWTAIPTLLVTAIAVVSAIVLAKNGNAGPHPLRVEVTAQQFAWTFKYPDQGNLTSGTLRLPLDRPVKLHMTSLDVIHSFWVPDFSQKQDIVPGLHPDLVITPDKIGTYPVICTELCGLGHAVMRTSAVVMSQADFASWAKSAGKENGGSPGQAGAAVFQQNGCASCHALKAANASGKIGPDLDNLPAEAKRAGKPLASFVKESIVKPDAYIEPGFPPNVMPKTFSSLPASQLDALVQYLVTSSKGS